jgi:hypothetical protein
MWQIKRGLFLGNAPAAHDRCLLLGLGITHVLNCAREIPCWYRTDFRYLHLKMTDPDPSFLEHIERICQFIHRGRKAGGVLVHCRAGISRSPSAILAYLCRRGMGLEEALELIRRRVRELEHEYIEPDPSFLAQIELYLEDREGDWEDD